MVSQSDVQTEYEQHWQIAATESGDYEEEYEQDLYQKSWLSERELVTVQESREMEVTHTMHIK